MNLTTLSNPVELLFAILGFALTISVLSYAFGDNVFFRLAIHLFIGVAAAFAAAMAAYHVIWPQLIMPLIHGNLEQRLFAVVVLVLGLLLLAKLSLGTTRLGSPVVAILVGIGAATAIGGAVMGTLFPQVLGSINILNPPPAVTAADAPMIQLFNATLVLLGTLLTLIYFQFSTSNQDDQPAQRPAVIEPLAKAGQGFIAVTLGVLFAGVYTAALTALVERGSFMVEFIRSFLSK